MTSSTIDRPPLTYAEVEKRLGIKRSTLRNIVRRRELGTVIVGGRPRILERQLAEYIERQTREAVT